ncbi:MAG: lipocalin-like domain-containing protein [Myxococcota bacterium]
MHVHPPGRVGDPPYRTAPDGVLVYAPDGGMAVAIAHAHRDPLGVTDFRGGTDRAKARALDTFAGYGGTWRLDGPYVVHTVKACSFPDWRGAEQRRRVSWRDGALVLSTDPVEVEGAVQVAELVWQRIDDQSLPPKTGNRFASP